MVIETPDGNLSKGMRQLNGVYTQASNRRHDYLGDDAFVEWIQAQREGLSKTVGVPQC